MPEAMSWAITALVVVLLAAFVGFVVGISKIPMGRRPRTTTYDRLGRPIGRTENPDFHANPGEDPGGGPDTVPKLRERLRRQ